jgi:very-short-patch-repair endonuclease
MDRDIDLRSLRELMREPLKGGTHGEISERFEALGIVETETGRDGTKAARVESVLTELSERHLVQVAQRLLRARGMTPWLRNQIEDVLWAGQAPLILERTRRALALTVDIENLVVDPDRFEALLDRWWVLGESSPFDDFFPSTGAAKSSSPLDALFPAADKLRKDIRRHVFRNCDWDTERLFESLGAFTAVDRRFVGFLADLVSHQVLVHEANQRRVVEAMAPVLSEARLELREIDTDGGYPVYGIVSIGQQRGGPKNLIFASTGKPDLRLSSSVDNEIELVDNGVDVLVFDDPVSAVTGLTWRDLQKWWGRGHLGQDDDAAKRALYRRLRASIPPNSPPQQRLFDLYYKILGSRAPNLPALLPEVWLHWDHRTVAQRGAEALLGQRMDFLLLGPHHSRIVLEVDGESHYTDSAGHPSPMTYGRHTQQDRHMRLRGYDVYRFGGAELSDQDKASALLVEFFDALFERHGIRG